MNVYWLAIDKSDGHSSYEEFKDRSVIAQGWSSINLTNLFKPTAISNRALFDQGVLTIGQQVYGNYDWWLNKDQYHVPRIMYMLASLKKGDLIVGIEGIKVRGICEVKINGWDSYYYDASSDLEYRNTFGGKVEWVDWCPYRIGKAPIPPAQSVKGIASLNKERSYVINVWKALKPENLRYSIGLVEDTIRVYDDLMDGKCVYRDDKVFFKHGDGRTGYFVNFANVYCREWILEDIKKIQPPIEFSSIEDIVREGWVLD